MTRKALEKFDPAKLAKGHSKSFEVRNQTSGHSEHHYFYRDQDGELFTYVAHRLDECHEAKKEWLRLKRAKPSKLKQKSFLPQWEQPELIQNDSQETIVTTVTATEIQEEI